MTTRKHEARIAQLEQVAFPPSLRRVHVAAAGPDGEPIYPDDFDHEEDELVVLVPIIPGRRTDDRAA